MALRRSLLNIDTRQANVAEYASGLRDGFGMTKEIARSVILNRVLNRSITQAKGRRPPFHAGEDLLDRIAHMAARGQGFENFSGDDEIDDDNRVAAGSFIRASKIQKDVSDDLIYTFLIEFVNDSLKSFSVVDIETFEGREITAQPRERGSFSTHVVMRLPKPGDKDLAEYRCAIEYSPNVRRLDIQALFVRQLRRIAKVEGWDFPEERTSKRGQPLKPNMFKYHPKLEFAVDVGRSMKSLSVGKSLSKILLTKKAEKQSIGLPTEVRHMDVVADVQMSISGKEAPADPGERASWLDKLLSAAHADGFRSRVYYKGAGGKPIIGSLEHEVASAIDLMMCPRETIMLAVEPPPWRRTIDEDTTSKMVALLRDDKLWERPQGG